MEYIVKPNPDRTTRKMIAEAIAANDGYCCCAIEKSDATKCQCKAFREQEASGFCHCGLFYKVTDYPVVALCGSSRFKDDFVREARRLTLEGNLVLMPTIFNHAEDEAASDAAPMLDNLHKQRIAMSESIYVINRDGYVGESTAAEIAWAEELGKAVKYMEDIQG